MPIFPFFQYPYMNKYYSRNNIYSQRNNYDKFISNENNNVIDNSEINNTLNNKVETNTMDKIQNKSSRYTGSSPIHFQNPFSMNNEEPIIEILGISLYLDDIIILGLLFFLYQEGVKDYMLYLILILLLLN